MFLYVSGFAITSPHSQSKRHPKSAQPSGMPAWHMRATLHEWLSLRPSPCYAVAFCICSGRGSEPCCTTLCSLSGPFAADSAGLDWLCIGCGGGHGCRPSRGKLQCAWFRVAWPFHSPPLEPPSSLCRGVPRAYMGHLLTTP